MCLPCAANIDDHACSQSVSCVPDVSFVTELIWSVRFLQLVESRLSQLESDVRSLKSQQSEGGSVPDSTFADRRPSVQMHHVPATVHEPESEDSVVSPDATDGIGSIEFTKEDDSGYYGIEARAFPVVRLIGGIYFLTNFRAILQYCIHAQHSTGSFHTAFPEFGTAFSQIGVFTPAITRCISPTDTAQRIGQAGC